MAVCVAVPLGNNQDHSSPGIGWEISAVNSIVFWINAPQRTGEAEVQVFQQKILNRQLGVVCIAFDDSPPGKIQ